MKNMLVSKGAGIEISRKNNSKVFLIGAIILICNSTYAVAAENYITDANAAIMLAKRQAEADRLAGIKKQCEIENDFKMFAVDACVKSAMANSDDKSTTKK